MNANGKEIYHGTRAMSPLPALPLPAVLGLALSAPDLVSCVVNAVAVPRLWSPPNAANSVLLWHNPAET